MASSQASQLITRQVRPLLSIDSNEAKRRVLSLYKAWYRQIPFTVKEMHFPKNVQQCREKLREEFMKHKDVKDVRAIDMLVIKGQMELREVASHWKQKGHVMAFWKDSVNPKPQDFLSKFLESKD